MLTWFLKNTLKEKHILRAWKSSLKTSLGFLILKVSETFPTGHAQKGYSEVNRDGASPQKGYSEIKRDGASPHVSDINLPYRPLR